MNLKPMEWYNAPGSMLDGKTEPDSIMADDVVDAGNACCISIRYDIKHVTNGSYNKWHVLIVLPGPNVHYKADFLEEAKIFCTIFRREFWNKMYNEMMKEIFEKESA